ncbi:MAG: hypothetical protein KDD56_01205 [Bdellovibrionales bacterium]|nr:hypothetical protein [Bdellovibrionales bacterium]
MSKDKVRADSLSPSERAAILLLSLGKDTAAEVMRRLSPEEAARIAKSFPTISDAPVEVHKQVHQEFSKIARASEKVLVDGKAFAKDVLEKVFGAQHQLEQGDSSEEIRSLLLSVPDEVISSFIEAEHIQTASFLLSVMDPSQAARILGKMDETQQYDILIRVSFLKPVNSALISEVKEIIRKELLSEKDFKTDWLNGKKSAANIINSMSDTNAKRILDNIADLEPDLKDELDQLVFTFDDLEKIPQKSLQGIIQECPKEQLVIALKTAKPELINKILLNVSARIRTFIEEELKSMGPKRKVDVERAQSAIIGIAKKLEAEGKISLKNSVNEEEWV